MRSVSACHVTLLWAARPAIDKALFPGRERSNAIAKLRKFFGPRPGPVLQFQEVYDTSNKSREELVSRKYSDIYAFINKCSMFVFCPFITCKQNS